MKNTISFMVGTNFSEFQLDYIINEPRITEVYGSMPLNAIGSIKLPTARPDFRLPQITSAQLCNFVRKLHEHGKSFNYTLNASATEIWYFTSEKEIREMFNFLESIEIDRVTLAHPIPLMYAMDYNFKIELSTIMNINNLDAVKWYFGKSAKIDKICLSIYSNRDFKFLRQANQIAEDLGSFVELLVNEFCNIHGMPCTQFYRKACYELNSYIHHDPKYHDNFPKNQCTRARAHPVSWIKAPFISPYDLNYYMAETGIDQFKISGRTYSNELWEKTIYTYLNADPAHANTIDNNILGLWGHVSDNKDYDFHISLKGLFDLNFIENFPKLDSCSRKLCSECGYCHYVYQMHQKFCKEGS